MWRVEESGGEWERVCGELRRMGEGVWRVEESGGGCVESGGEWRRVCGIRYKSSIFFNYFS